MDWLTKAGGEMPLLGWDVALTRLLVSLVMGILVTQVYHATRQGIRPVPSFPATLVLLTVLITMTTQVIGDNVARAFSLVGALSIVRFRTVVRDTKDTAFVILAVIIGMTVGAGQVMAALYGLAVVTLGAWLFRDRPTVLLQQFVDYRLEVKLAYSPELEQAILEIVSQNAVDVLPSGAATVRQGVGLELVYQLRLPATFSPSHLVAQLVRLDGIHGIELRQSGRDS